VKQIFSLCLFLTYFISGFAQTPPFDLGEATIDTIHAAYKENRVTAEQVAVAYLERIKAYNFDLSRGAPINAFVSINPSLIEDARRLDEHYKKTGQFVGPLHGIPVVLKDNINSYDTPTTAGSLAMLGSQPVQDAFLAAKLREAGALLLGKTAMDEFADGMFAISSRTGRTGNPYNPNENPGGSSGGSAAAVNAGFAVIGIGTDNSGSIRIPAVFNGLYGLRPSTGLVSQSGIFPRGGLDGVAGPITRSVKDLAIALAVIAQIDLNDVKTQNIPRFNAYASRLTGGWNGKKIGIVKKVGTLNPYEGTPEHIQQIYQNFFELLQRLGVQLVDVELPLFNNDRHNNTAGEIEEINAYLQSFPSTRQNFVEICQSNRTRIFGDPEDCLKYIESTAKKNSVYYRDVLKMFAENRTYVTNMMNYHGVDALLMPICRIGVPTYDPEWINTWRMPVSSNSGLPSLALIAGYSADMPVGVEFIGKMYQEADLLALAYQIETSAPKRKIPPLTGPGNLFFNRLSISQINNFITLLGYTTFNLELINKPRTLAPEKFRNIVELLIQSFSNP
jgi:aspartyl-tRNA(Asn)/glutamyl-tRNA(Gln) amidotransferase subunit A